jgi:hypothetical protein
MKMKLTIETIETISLAEMVDVCEQAEDKILESTDSSMAFFRMKPYQQLSSLLNFLRMAKNATGERQQMILKYAKRFHLDMCVDATRQTPEYIKSFLKEVKW